MGIKNKESLGKKHYPDVVNEDGSVRNGFFDDDGKVRSVADGDLELAWHEGQAAALAAGETLEDVQRFMDHLPRRVFLPWLQALTEKANQNGAQLDNIVKKGVYVFDDIFETFGPSADYATMLQYFGVNNKAYVLDKATKSIYYVSPLEVNQYKVGAIDQPEPIIDLGSVTSFEMGTVTTLPAGSAATATLSGTDEKPILNLGIPQGKEGARGRSGVHVGSEEPMDEDAVVWIDPDDQTEINAIQGDCVTPQMFGAVADGKTDDTKAIQDALDCGGTIYFPKGRYKVTKQLTANYSCKIIMCKPIPVTYHYHKSLTEGNSLGDVPFDRYLDENGDDVITSNHTGARIEVYREKTVEGEDYGLLIGDGMQVDGLYMRAMDGFSGVLFKYDGSRGYSTYPSQVRISHVQLDVDKVELCPESMFDFVPTKTYFLQLDDIIIGSLKNRMFSDYGFRAIMNINDSNWSNSVRINNMCIDICAKHAMYIVGGKKGAGQWVIENLSIQGVGKYSRDFDIPEKYRISNGAEGGWKAETAVTFKSMQSLTMTGCYIWDLSAAYYSEEVVHLEDVSRLACFGCGNCFQEAESVLHETCRDPANLNIKNLSIDARMEKEGIVTLTLSDGILTREVDIPMSSSVTKNITKATGLNKLDVRSGKVVKETGSNISIELERVYETDEDGNETRHTKSRCMVGEVEAAEIIGDNAFIGDIIDLVSPELITLPTIIRPYTYPPKMEKVTEEGIFTGKNVYVKEGDTYVKVDKTAYSFGDGNTYYYVPKFPEFSQVPRYDRDGATLLDSEPDDWEIYFGEYYGKYPYFTEEDTKNGRRTVSKASGSVILPAFYDDLLYYVSNGVDSSLSAMFNKDIYTSRSTHGQALNKTIDISASTTPGDCVKDIDLVISESLGNPVLGDIDAGNGYYNTFLVSNMIEAEYGDSIRGTKLGDAYVAIDTVTAPTFEKNKYYTKTTSGYVLLNSEPSDWSTDWIAYHIKTKKQQHAAPWRIWFYDKNKKCIGFEDWWNVYGGAAVTVTEPATKYVRVSFHVGQMESEAAKTALGACWMNSDWYEEDGSGNMQFMITVNDPDNYNYEKYSSTSEQIVMAPKPVLTSPGGISYVLNVDDDGNVSATKLDEE